MEVLVRDYRPGDAKAVIAVYRDAVDSLRKSKGGSHPDEFVKKLLDPPDDEILRIILYTKELCVAEYGGEIVGIGGITNRLKNRLMGSTYSANHYVKSGLQGKGIGTLLKRWTIQRARTLGFRKIYGYCTPEGKPLNLKFGAVFFPGFDSKRGDSGVSVHYYEIALRKSVLNGLRLEPYVSEMSGLSRLLRGR